MRRDTANSTACIDEQMNKPTKWLAFFPVVVFNEEWEAAFKQLKTFGKTKVLHALNPKYNDIEFNKEVEFRIIGVVIEKMYR